MKVVSTEWILTGADWLYAVIAPIESGDSAYGLDAAPFAGPPDKQDELNGASDGAAGDVPRNLADQIFQSRQSVFGTVGVQRCQTTGMPGIPCLQQCQRFSAADFAHHNAVGSQPQRTPDKIIHRDYRIGWLGEEFDAVR